MGCRADDLRRRYHLGSAPAGRNQRRRHALALYWSALVAVVVTSALELAFGSVCAPETISFCPLPTGSPRFDSVLICLCGTCRSLWIRLPKNKSRG